MAPKHELNFLELLQQFRRGEMLSACDQKLNELTQAIADTGTGGALTLKLNFKVNKAGQVELNPDISIKKPSRALGTGIYYPADTGRLSTRHPDQLDIEDEIERRRALDA